MRYYYCIPTSMAKIKKTVDRCQNRFASCEGCLNWEEGIFSGDRNVLYRVDVVTQGNTVDP